MSFNYTVFKDQLAELEKDKRWTDVFYKVADTWGNVHDSHLAGLCIDQCFLFDEWLDYEYQPEIKALQMKNWMFMNEVVTYGLKYFWKEPYFLWRLGEHMAGGAGSGYLLLNYARSPINVDNFDDICEKVLNAAYKQCESPLVLCLMEGAKGNWDWPHFIDVNTRLRAKEDILRLNLRSNMTDKDIKYHYDWVDF